MLRHVTILTICIFQSLLSFAQTNQADLRSKTIFIHNYSNDDLTDSITKSSLIYKKSRGIPDYNDILGSLKDKDGFPISEVIVKKYNCDKLLINQKRYYPNEVSGALDKDEETFFVYSNNKLLLTDSTDDGREGYRKMFYYYDTSHRLVKKIFFIKSHPMCVLPDWTVYPTLESLEKAYCSFIESADTTYYIYNDKGDKIQEKKPYRSTQLNYSYEYLSGIKIKCRISDGLDTISTISYLTQGDERIEITIEKSSTSRSIDSTWYQDNKPLKSFFFIDDSPFFVTIDKEIYTYSYNSKGYLIKEERSYYSKQYPSFVFE